MAELIIVSGSPGTGKSIISSQLSQLLECNVIESSELFKSAGILLADPTGRDTFVIDEFKAQEFIREFVRRRGCFVVNTLHPVLWIDSAYDNVIFTLLLRCNPRVLLNRLNSRGWSRVKVIENVLAEAFNVIAEELLEYEDLVLEVDTSHGVIDRVMDETLSKLESWDTGIRIDWLSLDSGVIDLVTQLVHELDLYKERLGV